MRKATLFAFSFSLGLHVLVLTGLFLSSGESPLPLGATLELVPFAGKGETSAPSSQATPPAAEPHEDASAGLESVTRPSAVADAGEQKGSAGVINGNAQASAKERYLFELRLYLDQNKKYPPRARALRQAGKVLVRFSVRGDGSFSDVKLLEESPFAALNQEAGALFARLGHFRPLPPELGPDPLELELPLVFSLER